MKRFILSLVASLTPAFAQLPPMSDSTPWLGYFVGWEKKSYDFGIGADGESVMHLKEKGKRAGLRVVKIAYVVEEKIDGEWVRRRFLKEGGLESENEKGLEPKKPVVLVTTVTGGTKVEWTHTQVGRDFAIMPKLLEKTTENEIKIGVLLSTSQLYRIEEELDERELKKRVGGDQISGKRLKDGKKARVRFYETDKDLLGEKYFKEGASEIEVESERLVDSALKVANGSSKAGRIDIVNRGKLYSTVRLMWTANPEKIGEKGTYLTFGLE